jgi:hypothetical protein
VILSRNSLGMNREQKGGKKQRVYLNPVHKPTVSRKVVIPAKAGIQSFQEVLDAPVSEYGAGSLSPA